MGRAVPRSWGSPLSLSTIPDNDCSVPDTVLTALTLLIFWTIVWCDMIIIIIMMKKRQHKRLSCSYIFSSEYSWHVNHVLGDSGPRLLAAVRCSLAGLLVKMLSTSPGTRPNKFYLKITRCWVGFLWQPLLTLCTHMEVRSANTSYSQDNSTQVPEHRTQNGEMERGHLFMCVSFTWNTPSPKLLISWALA